MRTASAFIALTFTLALFGACALSPASSDNALAGTSWELRALVEGSDSLTTVPRDGLYFMDDGGVSIHSCNACNGFYIAEGNR